MDKHLAGNLVALESKLDAVLFAADATEEMPKKKRGMGGVIAAPVAAGVGAMALRKRYGADQIQGVGNQAAATFRGAAREAGDIAGRVPGALTSAGKSFRASRTLNKSGLFKSGLNAVKKAGRVLVAASAKTQLTTLGEKLDGLLEFKMNPDDFKEETKGAGETSRKFVKRAAGVAAGGLTLGALGNLGSQNKDKLIKGARSVGDAVGRAGIKMQKAAGRGIVKTGMGVVKAGSKLAR